MMPEGGSGGGWILGSGRGYRVLAALVVLVFLGLIARLWHLQVLRGDHYYRKSADNFVKEVELPATRGQVLDARRRVLVDNRPSYNVYVTPRFLTDDAVAKLAGFLKLDADRIEALKAKAAARKGVERFHQILAFEDVTHNEMATIDSHRLELPGVAVDAQPHRNYPYGKVGAHVLGYMNEIGADELAKMRDQGYRPGDYVGRAGVERQWESYLRGRDGFERIFVDAKGRVKTDVELEIETAFLGGEGPKRQEPLPGDNVVLTLDLDLQKLVEKALAHHRSAAAAVVDVSSGRVLALASHPSFDPNVLTGRLTHAEADRLEKDPYRPLIDKALRENYYPGSTFKIVPALAALESKLVTDDEKMICHSAYQLPGHTFRCMKSHGPMNIHSAMVESCNIFFYHLGERVGMDRMAELASDLGFGAPTGIGLNGEVPGFIPTQEWYRKQQGGFRIGYTLNTAIGQGSTKVTVLQLALAYAAIANGGDLYVPALVERIEKPSGQIVQSFSPRLRHKIAAAPENLDRVRRSLCGVVNEPKGTVFEARDPTIPEVCGKSGTAQVRKNKKGEAAGWDVGNDHAWFASFGPAKKPEIAVVVLVEHGGLGGHVAAPTAMEIYKGYFANQAVGAPTAPPVTP